MKSFVTIIAILLIIFGVVGLGYKGFSYTSQEKVAQLGNVQITAENPKTIYIPPLVSGISIVVGVVMLVLGNRKGS